MNFFEIVQLLGSNIWIYGCVFIIILSTLVFVHEWGHFIVAKLCGVKVEVFSIGFGKELGGFEDKHGTRWKFALIPLGGYVKLFGDVDPTSVKHMEGVKENDKIRPLNKAEREVAFFAKPVWQRAAIVVAGPAINYIFAIAILTGLFIFNGQPITPATAAAVIGGSSADEYGFQPHDRVVSIDDNVMTSFEDIRREMMIALDQEKHFVVERNGKYIDIFAKPQKVEEKDRFGFRHSRGLLGLISPRHAVDITNIRKIEGKSYKEGQTDKVRADLMRRMGTAFTIEIERGPTATDVLTIKPLKEFNDGMFGMPNAEGKEPSEEDANLLFIADSKGNSFKKYGPPMAFVKAIQESWTVTTSTVEALWQMVVGTRSATELGGVIRIGALAGDMAKQGIVAVILFTALLSINLGLINLFPIPMLDGGHLLFYAIEAILGRPIPDQIQEYAFRFGLVFLVGIMVFANLNDILQLIL